MADTYADYLEHQAQHVRAEQLIALNGPYIAHVHPDQPVRRTVVSGVEQWRVLVGRWFPPDRVDEALAIIWCESRGDPTARNPVSSASGLWQFLRGWWSGKWSDMVGVFDPRDPVAAMRAAAIVSKNGTDWGDWSESRHCHGL